MDAILGKIKKEIEDDDEATEDRMTKEEREVLFEENKRAYNDLLACLPTGRWTKKIGQNAISDTFEGKPCAATAWKMLEEIVNC